ncbi:TPA: hypothetical protein N3A49_004740 [Salmonella enterica subsp. salamae serovar 56:l,v:z39]|nr:hypothetical protein [Salmonella enterica subsp. salamae serovar 56:l,v:z39]
MIIKDINVNIMITEQQILSKTCARSFAQEFICYVSKCLSTSTITSLIILCTLTLASKCYAGVCLGFDNYSGSLPGYDPVVPIVISPPVIDSSSNGLIFSAISNANIGGLQTQMIVHSSGGIDEQSCAASLRGGNFYGYDLVTTENPLAGGSYNGNPYYRINDNISYALIDNQYGAVMGNTIAQALTHSGFMGAYQSISTSCFYVKGESGVPYCYPGSSTNRWRFVFRINTLPIGGVLTIPAGFTLASMSGYVNMAGGEVSTALLPSTAAGLHSIKFTTGSGMSIPLPVNCNISSQAITHDYGTLPPNSTMSKTSTISLTCNMAINGTLEIVNGAPTGLTPVNIGSYGSANIGISVDGAKPTSREPFAITANVPRTFTIQTNIHTGKTPGSFSGSAVINHVIN